MERNGEVGEILSDAWEQYRREKWNALVQETKIALSVSASSTFPSYVLRERERFRYGLFGWELCHLLSSSVRLCR